MNLLQIKDGMGEAWTTGEYGRFYYLRNIAITLYGVVINRGDLDI